MILFSEHCDEEYNATAESGIITSPDYPNYYPNNVTSCVTTIYANESQLIQLNFEEFSLESESNCSYDYLEVKHSCLTMPHCLMPYSQGLRGADIELQEHS